MKQLLNALIALVFIFNQVVSFPSAPASAGTQPQSPSNQKISPAFAAGYNAYPPPVTPTPIPTAVPTRAAPIPTATPTAVPMAIPTATPTPTITPPVPANRLTLSSSPNYGVVDQDLNLNWDFQPSPEWVGKEKSLEMILSFPTSFTPSADLLSRFNAKTGELRLPLAKIGQLQGKIAKEVSGSLSVIAKVVSGEQVVAEMTLTLLKGGISNLPASGGEAISPNGKIKVVIPQDALDEDIFLCIGETANHLGSTSYLGSHPFEINAEGKTSFSSVHQFRRPISIIYQYDPKEIAVDENYLTLEFYNETTRNWVKIPTQVDTKRHVLIGTSDHLSPWDIGSESIDKYKLNDLSAYNVSDYQGVGTYSVPINLPAGPAGFTPSLAMTYNSALPDAAGLFTQASWVGMGWDLNVGTIDRNTRGTATTTDDYFSISLNGISDELIPASKGADYVDSWGGTFPSYIEYHTKDVSYLRIRKYVSRYKLGRNNQDDFDFFSDTSYCFSFR